MKLNLDLDNKVIGRDSKIDFFKGIAMLMVIFVHSTRKFPGINEIIYNVSGIGQLGTQIFLVLTGITSVFSYEKNKNKKTFMKKRLGSIIPAWEISIVMYVVINTIIVDVLHIRNVYESSNDLIGILVNVFLLNGIIPKYNNNVVPGGWYVGTLIVLYMLFPMIYDIICSLPQKILKKNFLVVLILWTIIWRVIGKFFGPHLIENNSFLYFSFLNQMPAFIIGVGIAYNNGRYIKRELLDITQLFKGIVYILAASILFLSKLWWGYCVVPTMFALGFSFIYIAIPTIEQKRRSIAIISWIGKNSYYVYLTHVLWVLYLPGVVYFAAELFEINYYPTAYWLVLLMPMILLSCLSAVILKKTVMYINTLIEKRVKC